MHCQKMYNSITAPNNEIAKFIDYTRPKTQN